MRKNDLSDEEFIKIVETAQSMLYASKLAGMAYTSFVRRAKALGVYKPNQGGVGINKKTGSNHIDTDYILKGNYPSYPTYKLKLRLIKEGYIKDECSICGWNKKPEGREYTPCELDHINGNPTDHRLENLRLICPNCHSLTPTYRFRRGKKNSKLGKQLLQEETEE